MTNSLRTRTAMHLASLLLVTGVLSACAGMSPGYETPTVSVQSFRPISSANGTGLPSFEIGLHVTNPNLAPLELAGVSYTISLDGKDVIKGVGNDLPVIDGYGEGEFKLTASANLFAGIRLITDLMRNNRSTFQYEFEAKLDIGAFLPAIRVRDSDEISFQPAT